MNFDSKPTRASLEYFVAYSRFTRANYETGLSIMKWLGYEVPELSTLKQEMEWIVAKVKEIIPGMSYHDAE